MIDLYVNHDTGFEILNLVKAFFFLEKVNILKENTEELKGNIYIENIWRDNTAITKIKCTRDSSKDLIVKKINIQDINILESSDSKRKRICLRKNLYEALVEYTGMEIEWGILTGVRPVKIIHSLFEKGISSIEIRKLLSREYKLSDKKIELIESIATIERKHIYPLNRDKYSLYVSIPFCPTRCSYCSFVSNKYDEDISNKYIDYLIYEMRRLGNLFKDKILENVYIGGGTPTSLSSFQIEKLLRELKKAFPQEFKEFTVEAGRPDTLSEEKLKILKNYGVDRISINPQTMNDNTLKKIDRNHSSRDIIDKYMLARQIGFDSINMDIIVGLPGEGPAEVENTMKELKKLNPENITVHTMALKRDSKISKSLDDYSFTESENIDKMLNITRYYAEEMKLKAYYMYRQKQMLGNFENIGYSIDGKECIYNILMMEEKQTILALGVGAVSKIFFPEKDRVERVPNFKDLEVYFNRIDEMIDRKKIFK